MTFARRHTALRRALELRESEGGDLSLYPTGILQHRQNSSDTRHAPAVRNTSRGRTLNPKLVRKI